MPELPEVETTLRAIRPMLEGQRIAGMRVGRRDLRWPVSPELPGAVIGCVVGSVRRRAKYLLLEVGAGSLIVHLGMSGSIRIMPQGRPAGPHDHVDIMVDGGPCLRYTDPRRFGSWIWTSGRPEEHALLRDLGPEPWETALTAQSLRSLALGRKVPVKAFIMDNAVLVGVGNIYATEALFRAGIHPARPAGGVSVARWGRLLMEIREVLNAAITSGGSTLRDFTSGEGRPGYFAQELQAYGREGLPCFGCRSVLRTVRIGGRASAYCPRCQR